jgi:chromate transport protein ChrA
VDPVTWSRQSSFNGLIRAGSTVGHANTLSAYLVMCLPLVVWLASKARSRVGATGWAALAAVSVFLAMASLSRGAWLGLAGVAVAALILSLASGRRPSRRWVTAAGAIALVALLLPLATPMRTQLLERVHQLTDLNAETTRTRVELWRAGIRMFREHPVAGAGLDAYVAAFPRYRTATLTEIEWGGTPAKAHNDAIQILATQGLLGGLAALAILILCARSVWHIARRGSPELRGAAVTVGACFAGYIFPSFVGFGTVATSALAAALAGWSARAARVADAHVPESTEPARHETPHEGAPVRSAWNLAAGFVLAAALWYVLVQRPLAAEMALGHAMRYPAGSAMREDALEEAAAAAPWDPRYSAELGRSLFYRGLSQPDPRMSLDLLAQARTALTTAVQAAPENGENRILLASVLSTQTTLSPDQYPKEEVRREFLRAVELDPQSPVVLVSAVRGLMAAGLDADAHPLALRAARAYPDYAPPLADLGAIALEQGRNADAADTLKIALGRNWRGDEGSAATAWNDLARAYLALGRNPEAMAAADSALARNSRLSQAFVTKETAKRNLSLKER